MELTKLINDIFTDNNDKFSLMRISKFIALSTTFIVWGIVSIETCKLYDIPSNLTYLLIALVLGKAVQKLGER